MKFLCILVLPSLCLSQFFHQFSTEKEIEEFLAAGQERHLKESGILECIRKERKSPININLANTTLSSFPPLILKNYLGYEKVTEVEANNATATISGYDKWTKRPTLSGGPLNGNYQLTEIHWDMMSIALPQHLLHYGHTVNGAKYDLELHFVHTINGTSVEEARKHPNGVAIVTSFLIEEPMTRRDLEYFQRNYTENSMKMIPNETGKPFEWVPPSFLLPDVKDVYFAYNGTFAHPPCEGDVTWILMATPITMCRLEMTRYLHAAGTPNSSLAMLSASMKMLRDNSAEVFLNFPKRDVPEAEPLVAENSWHSEVLSGIALATLAVVFGVSLTAYAYRHYGKKQTQETNTADANFHVGFDNINFLNQNS